MKRLSFVVAFMTLFVIASFSAVAAPTPGAQACLTSPTSGSQFPFGGPVLIISHHEVRIIGGTPGGSVTIAYVMIQSVDGNYVGGTHGGGYRTYQYNEMGEWKRIAHVESEVSGLGVGSHQAKAESWLHALGVGTAQATQSAPFFVLQPW